MLPEALQFKEYLDGAIKEREDQILRGALVGTGAELGISYKLATMEVTNLKRIRTKFDEIFNKKAKAEEAESGMTPLEEEDR